MTPSTTPTLDLGDIAQILAENDLSKDGWKRLARFVSEEPRFAEQIAELEQLTRDAGMVPEPEDLLSGLIVNEDLDELLATSDWRHPGELFDTDPEDVRYDAYLNVADARLARAEDPQLRALRERLAHLQAEQKAKDELLDRLEDTFRKMNGAEAERYLGFVRGRYEFSREKSEPEAA